MRILVPLVLLGLTGLLACNRPPEGGAESTAGQSGRAGSTALLGDTGKPLPYPDELLSYLSSALDKPTEGYPALGNTWSVIASLPWPQPPDRNPAQEALTAKVSTQVTGGLAAGKPPPELLAAWLALNPKDGAQKISDALKEQQWRQLQALRFDREAGRELLRAADFQHMSSDGASVCLDLLREWGSVEAADRVWLEVLAGQENQNISLRAAGWLLRLELQESGPESDKADTGAQRWRDMLGKVVRDQSSSLEPMAAACEGIRISGDAKMADALVNLAAKALASKPGELSQEVQAARDAEKAKQSAHSPHSMTGTEQPASPHGKLPAEEGGSSSNDPVSRKEEKKKEDVPADKAAEKAVKPGQNKSGQTSFELLYTVYALAYLPGEQATLLRQKLLGAEDPNVAWHARLGELLHGDPGPWDAALKQEGFSHQLWLALETREAVHPGLLATYQQAAASESSEYRVDAARQLERFASLGQSGLAGVDQDLVALLQLLTGDKVDAVRQLAWFSAAELRPAALGPEALRTAQDAQAPPVLRLAACYTALSLLGHGIAIDMPTEAAPPAPGGEPAGSAGEGQG